ncbi:MAG: hypothetical protein JWL87_737 [Candidatus Adlerbacteria bacterium]|nr:hypothetical protein [Candidatus Adlerbacteria bacterium]
MHKYLIILAVAFAALSAPAYAQTKAPSRFETVMTLCKYRAQKIKHMINTGAEKKETIVSYFDSLPSQKWDQVVDSCRKYEAKSQVPPSAPAGTEAKRPKGEPKEIVTRPAGAPMNEYYRCNGETKMPDPRGTKICGPV